MEIQITGRIGLTERFAKLVDGIIENGKVVIPERHGKGYVRGFMFGTSMTMMVQDCELKSDLLVLRKAKPNDSENVIFRFNNVFKTNLTEEHGVAKIKVPSVQVGSSNIDTESIFEKTVKYNAINIAVNIDYLKELIDSEIDNAILKTIAAHNQTFLFEELISPAIQRVANEIASAEIELGLQQFYFKLKAEELICLLFVELLKRENVSITSLNATDVKMIYKIRDSIIYKLNKPPIISELAKMANFSESKLQRVFKQVFGNSIFNYYQSFRIKEAATLLRENKLSVSEVGYQLGFSNLSHFGKIFEEHIGIKPKKYSLR